LTGLLDRLCGEHGGRKNNPVLGILVQRASKVPDVR
jgi:hypothetical protein